jgi:hypothetical protein
MNYDTDTVFDKEYIRRKRAGMVPDGGSVRCPVTLMDSAQRDAYSRTDTRSEAVRLRDDAWALMVDRMKNPKKYDPITGKCLDDPDEVNEDQAGTAGPSRDNRRVHYPKQARDHAEAIKLRDQSYALMVDRMRNPKSYDMNGRRI